MAAQHTFLPSLHTDRPYRTSTASRASHRAAELAPYICLADITGSRAFGWGLTRTETIAQGFSRCDFRFKRHGETRVRVKLPVVP